MSDLMPSQNVTVAARKAQGRCADCAAVLPTVKYVRCDDCREQRAEYMRGYYTPKPACEAMRSSYAARIPCRTCGATFLSADRRSVRLCDGCQAQWAAQTVAEEFLYLE